MARKKAVTPEDRENQLIASAYNLAERQILEGTAATNVIVHFLKMGSSRERAEQVKLQHETALLQAKKVSIEREDTMEEMLKAAMEAMKKYGGHYNEED